MLAGPPARELEPGTRCNTGPAADDRDARSAGHVPEAHSPVVASGAVAVVASVPDPQSVVDDPGAHGGVVAFPQFTECRVFHPGGRGYLRLGVWELVQAPLRTLCIVLAVSAGPQVAPSAVDYRNAGVVDHSGPGCALADQPVSNGVGDRVDEGMIEAFVWGNRMGQW